MTRRAHGDAVTLTASDDVHRKLLRTWSVGRRLVPPLTDRLSDRQCVPVGDHVENFLVAQLRRHERRHSPGRIPDRLDSLVVSNLPASEVRSPASLAFETVAVRA